MQAVPGINNLPNIQNVGGSIPQGGGVQANGNSRGQRINQNAS